ncbi:MAG: trypsin-like peptidase domain-containing protein [Acidobacteria bacterium]|nr:trypsin-like peptidase domain-containing protein [Acidobacteriota bacterium]MCB9398522.1 trypsin-like peptidase domain-containing protein [Acidobacteriota bacterium]
MRFCFFCFFSLSLVGQVQTVLFKNGYSVRGDIVATKDDRVIVDLGFQVLVIPRDEITAIQGETVQTGSSDKGDRFFFLGSGRNVQSVRDNIPRCQAAVVEIRTPTSLGSGFVVRPDGYIVTNNHVISGETKISVVFFGQKDGLDKKTFESVEIIASNPLLDLALLRISQDGLDLPFVPLGDSDGLREGETVFAIGSPLGLERTVSEGIISLKNRLFDGLLFIQTTTQINPGNSGGPLFNLRGEVVGVNNMKLSSVGIEGMAFSIPVNQLKSFLNNRDAFAFDARNPNAGYRYLEPPRPVHGPKND